MSPRPIPLPKHPTPGAAGSVQSEHRPGPAKPTQICQAERDRSGASIEGDHPKPSRTARKLPPPPSLPASEGPIPRSPQIRQAERDRSGASIGTYSPYSPSRASAKAQLAPTFPASAGPIPRSPVEAPMPSASPSTPPPENRCGPPGACGVPSERSGCAPYPGFHPGLVYCAPLRHSERLTSPKPSCERRTGPAKPPQKRPNSKECPFLCK